MSEQPPAPESANPRTAGHSRAFVGVAIGALAILVACAFIYQPALHGAWLWDDDQDIPLNAVLRDPAGWWKIWFAPAGVDYFPLKSTVQWLAWQVSRDDVTGYHALNIALHAVNALLVWRLLAKLGVRFAWFAGLLFAVHPLAVESVAWIAELKNTLSLPPLLLALCAWIDFDTHRRRADYIRAIVWFVAALLCKPTVVMLPVVLLLHAWWKRGRIGRAGLAASAPFFAASLAIGLLTMHFQYGRAIGAATITSGGFLSRLAGAGLATAFYFSKFLVPAGLMPVYPRWEIDPPAPGQFVPLLIIALAFGWFWQKRATWGRHALLGGGFILLNLLPVLGLVRMAYLWVAAVADHFAYVSLVGAAGLAAAGLAELHRRLAPALRPWSVAGALGILMLLSWQSRAYAGVFRGPFALWTYAVEHNPRAPVVHNNLGNALLATGAVDAAITHYVEAVRLDPDYVGARDNLAGALVRIGRPRDAVPHFEAALRLQPGDAIAHTGLGSALADLGAVPAAIAEHERALALRPDYAEAHNNLGIALAQAGRFAEATAHFEEALRLSPDLAAARANLDHIRQQTAKPDPVAPP
jgi:tetratricopeptide (TPR) repeat protein